MFDIGFSEILLVAVVALVVIGPERLPGVARNIGQFAGRLQRYVNDVKRDFNREVEFEEIRRLQQEMETTVQSMQASMKAVEESLQHEGALQTSPPSDSVSEPAAAAPTAKPRKPRVTRKPEAPAVASTAPPVAVAEVAPQVASAAKPDEDQYRLF